MKNDIKVTSQRHIRIVLVRHKIIKLIRLILCKPTLHSILFYDNLCIHKHFLLKMSVFCFSNEYLYSENHWLYEIYMMTLSFTFSVLFIFFFFNSKSLQNRKQMNFADSFFYGLTYAVIVIKQRKVLKMIQTCKFWMLETKIPITCLIYQ